MRAIHYKKIVCWVFLWSTIYTVHAQEKASKAIQKSFPFSDAQTLIIQNKHGHIRIHGWQEDKIQISTTMTVTKSDKTEAEALLKRIETQMTILPNSNLSIGYTIQEKDEGMLAKLLGRSSAAEISKGNISVNHTIYLPQHAAIHLTNKFGDVILNDWNGSLKSDVQHGDMWMNTHLDVVDVNMKFGTLQSKSITTGIFTLKNSTLTLQTAKDLQIVSSGSTLTLTDIEKLSLSSSKDKIEAQTLQTVFGKLKFSKLNIKQIKANVNLQLDVVDCRIQQIVKKDAVLTIQQKSSEVIINIKDTRFNFNATLTQGLLRIPTTFQNIKTTMIDDRKKLRTITASYGTGDKGVLSITGEKGVILLQE